MKCPLLTDKNYGEQLERAMAKGDCIKGECAWYGTWTTEKAEEFTGCALPALVSVLAGIRHEIPKEYQFRERG